MKKNFLSVLFLITGILLTSCGQKAEVQGSDIVFETIGNGYGASDESGSGGAESDGTEIKGSETEEPSGKGSSEGDLTDAYPEKDAEGGEIVEDVFLSKEILKAGDTMQVMYPVDENTLYHGLDITLHEAKLYDSPEAAGLNRDHMLEETENYDISGEPVWCNIDAAGVLVCDLNIRNLEEDSDADQHISQIMVAYADPETGKVTIVSCAPAYFSASSSETGASDYYHYNLPGGESADMTVAWLIQEQCEAENLYLCLTYDVCEPEERQYFRLIEQE